MGTPQLWIAFLTGVAVMVAVDLYSSRGKIITGKKAAAWTGLWVTLSLGFAGVVYSLAGPAVAGQFVTAYVVEYALSVDNLFVFLVVFSYFRVPPQAQHRLLYWGIIGAFVMRGALIFAGTALVSEFEWLLYVFGAFLLYTSYKLLFSRASDDVDPEASGVLKLARRVLPVSAGLHGERFMVREAGRLKVTPLFLVLLVVESTDLLFALDSIPAVMGISKDPFIIFSSNACAILGLRSLFFVISGLMEKFRFLKVGLGIILAFVGLKLIAETAFHDWTRSHEGVVIAISLGFIFTTLVGSILASVWWAPKVEVAADEHLGAPQPGPVK